MIAYITTQGAKIRREGRRLIVCTLDDSRTLFVDELEQLLLFGNVQLTPQARFLLLREGIDTIFLRADGRYMGRLESEECKNVFLRKKQFLLSDNKEFCLSVAREIVQAKLHNQATLLARIKREHQQEKAGNGAEELKRLARKAALATSMETLRGVEGAGAALYFQHLPLAFHKDWGFTKRVRRPPTDPVNVVLSLLYTLLTARCYAACRIAGLDPAPGCLHTMEYGRHSLPLDLVEEFRALLADPLTISLFNLRMLRPEDFHKAPCHMEDSARQDTTTILEAVLRDPISQIATDNEGQITLPPVDDAPSEERGGQQPLPPPALLLAQDAYKKVLAAFSKKMETEFSHPHAGKKMSYSEAVIFQAMQYRRVVDGVADRYQPLTLR